MKHPIMLGILAVSAALFLAAPASAVSSHDAGFAHLSEGKRAVLMRMAAEHMLIMDPDAKEVTDAMIAREKRILAALEEALDIHGDVAKTFVNQHNYFNKQAYGALAEEFERPDLIDEQTSTESMLSIMLNRQEDIRALSAMLNAKELTPLLETYRGGREARVKDFTVAGDAKEKLVATVLQPKQFDRGEPAIHIYATAKGQMLEHAILARAFTPGGDVERALVKELWNRLKDLDEVKVEKIGKYYVGDRHYFATRVAKGFALDGTVVTEAIARSKKSQRKYDKK